MEASRHALVLLAAACAVASPTVSAQLATPARPPEVVATELREAVVAALPGTAKRARERMKSVCATQGDIGRRLDAALASLESGVLLPSDETIHLLFALSQGEVFECDERTARTMEAASAAQTASSDICTRAQAAARRAANLCQGEQIANTWRKAADRIQCRPLSLRSEQLQALTLIEEAIANAGSCPGAAELAVVRNFAAGVDDKGGVDGGPPAPGVTGGAISGWATTENAILNGLATFAIRRAQDEAIAYTTRRVGDTLCKTAREGAPGAEALTGRSLFPNSCAVVDAGKASELAVVPGKLLRDSLRADLNALPDSMHTALTAIADPKLNPAICALAGAAAVQQGFATRRHPLNVAVGIARDTIPSSAACRAFLGIATQQPTAEWARARAAVELVAEALLNPNNRDELEGWLANPDLLIARLRAEVSGTPGLEAFVKTLTAIVPPALEVERAAREYARLTAAERREPNKFVPLLTAAFALGDAVLSEGARADTAQALAEVRRVLAKLSEAAVGFSAGAYGTGLAALMQTRVIPVEKEPFKSFLAVSTVVIDIGSAQTGDEVATALENAAAPAGSWRIKRVRPTVGVTMRAGLLGGGEWAFGGNRDVALAGSVAPYLPLGFEASIPANGQALGIFVQLLDIGALGTVRIDGRSDGAIVDPATEPHVGFAQVVAPGLYLSWGIFDTPVVLGIGASFSPALRPVTFASTSGGGEAETENLSVIRFGATLSIDVPLFLL